MLMVWRQPNWKSNWACLIWYLQGDLPVPIEGTSSRQTTHQKYPYPSRTIQARVEVTICGVILPHFTQVSPSDPWLSVRQGPFLSNSWAWKGGGLNHAFPLDDHLHHIFCSQSLKIRGHKYWGPLAVAWSPLNPLIFQVPISYIIAATIEWCLLGLPSLWGQGEIFQIGPLLILTYIIMKPLALSH